MIFEQAAKDSLICRKAFLDDEASKKAAAFLQQPF